MRKGAGGEEEVLECGQEIRDSKTAFGKGVTLLLRSIYLLTVFKIFGAEEGRV